MLSNKFYYSDYKFINLINYCFTFKGTKAQGACGIEYQPGKCVL